MCDLCGYLLALHREQKGYVTQTCMLSVEEADWFYSVLRLSLLTKNRNIPVCFQRSDKRLFDRPPVLLHRIVFKYRYSSPPFWQFLDFPQRGQLQGREIARGQDGSSLLVLITNHKARF